MRFFKLPLSCLILFYFFLGFCFSDIFLLTCRQPINEHLQLSLNEVPIHDAWQWNQPQHLNLFLLCKPCLFVSFYSWAFIALTPLYEAGMKRQRNASPAAFFCGAHDKFVRLLMAKLAAYLPLLNQRRLKHHRQLYLFFFACVHY
jgi:hypothetical protein